MKKHLIALLLAVLLPCMCIPGNANAVAASTSSTSSVRAKGLSITPVRQFISVDAGKAAKSSLTVANYTASPLSVSVSVQQFSVTPYTYDYTFQPPVNSWLHLGSTNFALTPGKSVNIPYAITPPSSSAPGGHYYTLVASATLTTGGVRSTIQAADLIFITINGKLTTVSHLQSSHIQRFVFGRSIPFTLQPINTGNVYSFVYVSGLLHGWLVKPPETSAAHLLIPGKVRTLTDSIPSPALPGVYRATYGYKTTAGWAIQQSAWIVFIPPWCIAFVIAAVLLCGKFLPRRHKPKPKSEQSD